MEIAHAQLRYIPVLSAMTHGGEPRFKAGVGRSMFVLVSAMSLNESSESRVDRAHELRSQDALLHPNEMADSILKNPFKQQFR